MAITHPVVSLWSPHPGLFRVGGALAGEARGKPIIMPMAFGHAYIEYTPLMSGVSAMARRLTLTRSGVAPLGGAEGRGVAIVEWPGMIEVEFRPEIVREESDTIASEQWLDLTASVERSGGGAYLLMRNAGGQLAHELPDSARDVKITRMGGENERLLVRGVCEGGEFATIASMTEEGVRMVFSASATAIQPLAGGGLRVLEGLGDTVGHIRVTTYLPDDEKFTAGETEYLWENGAPHWPRTPEAAAEALTQAILLGLDSEAEGYLSAGARSLPALREMLKPYHLCLKPRYAMPQEVPAVHVLRLVGANHARVDRIAYEAQHHVGTQGEYAITEMRLLDD